MADMGRRSGFSADDLFRIRDNRVPLGMEHALRGLIKPFESIFPKSRVPNVERVASEFSKACQTRTPKQPPSWEMKKDWVEWILWELRLRLRLALRFHTFRYGISQKHRGRSDARVPIILFLREFREIRYNADVGAYWAVETEKDILLRDRIELMFPNCPVLWIANPRDDLNRFFTMKLISKKLTITLYPISPLKTG